jgi:hypothetical protein
MFRNLCLLVTIAAALSLTPPVAFAGKGHHHHRHVAKHYKHAPKGWHRHNHRPIAWYGRGCVMVGALWYCP